MELAPAPVSVAVGDWVSQAVLNTPPGADDVHFVAVVLPDVPAALGVDEHAAAVRPTASRATVAPSRG